MRFQHFSPRSDWKEKTADLGYLSSILSDPPYWIEAVENPFCAVFDRHEIMEQIIPATAEITRLAAEFVNEVCSSNSDGLFDKLCIPRLYRDAVRTSWKRGDQPFYGRIDFSYDGTTASLLELNFDTPLSLYEAAILQWDWLEDKKGTDNIKNDIDQFNSLHQQLVAAFPKLVRKDQLLHFACVPGVAEDEDTVKYLQSCALQAGLNTKFISMGELQWDDRGHMFDGTGTQIVAMFKLYPWEHFFYEDQLVCEKNGQSVLAELIQTASVQFIEPVWKCILSNKACLPLLWQMHGNHKNLLPATFDDDTDLANELRGGAHVKKPIFGREGGSVSINLPGNEPITNPAEYGKEGFVLQQYKALPNFEGFHMVIGSWVIDGKPAALSIRADRSQITSTSAHFIPHFVEAVK